MYTFKCVVVVKRSGGGKKSVGPGMSFFIIILINIMKEKNVFREFDYFLLLDFETEDPIRERRLKQRNWVKYKYMYKIIIHVGTFQCMFPIVYTDVRYWKRLPTSADK